jgi:riboflavin synthase
MFTGIIRHLGEVSDLSFNGATARLQVETKMDVADVGLGDSIAINGVCLTVVRIEKNKSATLSFDLGPETLECTSLGTLRATQSVHLEKTLQLSERINGHLVQGHVDGIGIIIQKEMQGEALILRIAAPQEIIQLCIPKGSISVDGVSLTINKINNGSFDLCLIPHTLLLTNFKKYDVGQRVNLENDMIGKYVFQFLRKPQQNDTGVSWDLLAKSGFLGSDPEVGTHL